MVVWCDSSDGLVSLFSLYGCKGFGDLIVGSELEVFGWLRNLGLFFFNGIHNCMTTFLHQVKKNDRDNSLVEKNTMVRDFFFFLVIFSGSFLR